MEALGREGIFLQMMEGLAAASGNPKTVMIDASYLKAHRTALSLRVKRGGLGRLIGGTKGGLNTKSHAVSDANGVGAVFTPRRAHLSTA